MITNEEYLMKHVKKAERELRKVALPYSRYEFVDTDEINFVIEDNDGADGYFRPGEVNTIMANSSFFKYKFKKKYNRRLISVLQHEMIHAYLYELDFYGLRVYADSSPLFASMVSWFNTHSKEKIDIRQNSGLKERFYLYNRELVYFSVDKDTTFEMLKKRMVKWQIALKNRLDDIACNIMDTSNCKKVCEFSFNSYSESETMCFVKYRKIKLNNETAMILELNLLALGMDINIYETDSEFTVEELIQSCTEVEYDGYKHYMNTIDDVA